MNCHWIVYIRFCCVQSFTSWGQFIHLGKQIAFFITLFAGANYDLNSNSICSPRCSIHQVRKSSELQQEGYKLPNLLTMRPPLKVSTNWMIRSKIFWRSNAQMQDVRCRGFNPKISNASSIRDIWRDHWWDSAKKQQEIYLFGRAIDNWLWHTERLSLLKIVWKCLIATVPGYCWRGKGLMLRRCESKLLGWINGMQANSARQRWHERR